MHFFRSGKNPQVTKNAWVKNYLHLCIENRISWTFGLSFKNAHKWKPHHWNSQEPRTRCTTQGGGGQVFPSRFWQYLRHWSDRSFVALKRSNKTTETQATEVLVPQHETRTLAQHSSLVHSGSKWLKPTKNKLTWRWFHEFFHEFCHIHIPSVSNHFRCIISKICQTVSGISMTSQFHDFFESHFWRIFWRLVPSVWCK